LWKQPDFCPPGELARRFSTTINAMNFHFKPALANAFSQKMPAQSFVPAHRHAHLARIQKVIVRLNGYPVPRNPLRSPNRLTERFHRRGVAEFRAARIECKNV
jgi:hypothetical protein